MLSSQDFIFPYYHSVISTFKNFQTDPMCSHNLVNFVSGHVKSPDHIYKRESQGVTEMFILRKLQSSAHNEQPSKTVWVIFKSSFKSNFFIYLKVSTWEGAAEEGDLYREMEIESHRDKQIWKKRSWIRCFTMQKAAVVCAKARSHELSVLWHNGSSPKIWAIY